MEKKMNFEDAMNELKNIVESLEKGDVSLEESLKLFERGSKLSSFCYGTLKDAEIKINEIKEQGQSHE